MKQERMTVEVRDRKAENDSWGSPGWTPRTRVIEIGVYCPECGGERGVPDRRCSYEDGWHVCVDVWENPCGHTDYYTDVIEEAELLAKQGVETGR